MKAVFIGTTDLGIPTLEVLKNNFGLSLVVTKPDKPVGRKKILTPSQVKVWAEKKQIPILQPNKISDIREELLELKPDIAVVAAYGKIMPLDILDIPTHKSINIHPSMLPKYRGPSPIQHTILNGDKTTGVTLIRMDEKMDHGPILTQRAMEVELSDNYDSLHQKLAILAADLIKEYLPSYLEGTVSPTPQDESQATYTKLLSNVDGRIDWSKTESEIERKIRGFNPEPGTWTTLNNKSVKILEAKPVTDSKIELPGKLYLMDNRLMVKCQTGSLEIVTIQPDGKKPMSGKDFLNGIRPIETKIFI